MRQLDISNGIWFLGESAHQWGDGEVFKTHVPTHRSHVLQKLTQNHSAELFASQLTLKLTDNLVTEYVRGRKRHFENTLLTGLHVACTDPRGGSCAMYASADDLLYTHGFSSGAAFLS